jgi:hypothetical protein
MHNLLLFAFLAVAEAQRLQNPSILNNNSANNLGQQQTISSGPQQKILQTQNATNNQRSTQDGFGVQPPNTVTGFNTQANQLPPTSYQQGQANQAMGYLNNRPDLNQAGQIGLESSSGVPNKTTEGNGTAASRLSNGSVPNQFNSPLTIHPQANDSRENSGEEQVATQVEKPAEIVVRPKIPLEVANRVSQLQARLEQLMALRRSKRGRANEVESRDESGESSACPTPEAVQYCNTVQKKMSTTKCKSKAAAADPEAEQRKRQAGQGRPYYASPVPPSENRNDDT